MRPTVSRKSRCRQGLTLVELLVSLVLSLLVIGAAFTVYQANSRYYYRQQAILEQEQNLRAALYIIARDVRSAGDGLKVMGVNKVQAYVLNPSGSGGRWFSHEIDAAGHLATSPGLRAIFGVDNDDAPDTLTVFRTEVESSVAFGQLTSQFNYNSSQLTLAEPVGAFQAEAGDVLGLVSGVNAVLVEAAAISGSTITVGARFKPGSAFPGGASFPTGTYVYNLRDVSLTTYWVDVAGRNLMARQHHLGAIDYDAVEPYGVIVSPGIEDFQVRYVLNDQDPGAGFDGLSMGVLDTNWVRQVNLGLVGRSGWRQPGAQSAGPVALYNHAAVGARDGFSRQVMINSVFLRNY
jgi:type IV pilus assembly protein PilW